MDIDTMLSTMELHVVAQFGGRELTCKHHEHGFCNKPACWQQIQNQCAPNERPGHNGTVAYCVPAESVVEFHGALKAQLPSGRDIHEMRRFGRILTRDERLERARAARERMVEMGWINA